MTGTAPAPVPAVLRLERRGTTRRDRSRPYVIWVDGIRRGVVYDGEIVELLVDPGDHTLRLSVDAAGSPTLDFFAESGEVAAFACEPSSRNVLLALLQTVWNRKAWIVLERHAVSGTPAFSTEDGVPAAARLRIELVALRRFEGGLVGYVKLDRQPVAKVRSGAAVEMPIAPGPHTLRLRGSIFGSPTVRFDAAPGSLHTFTYRMRFSRAFNTVPIMAVAFQYATGIELLVMLGVAGWVFVGWKWGLRLQQRGLRQRPGEPAAGRAAGR